MQIGFGVVYHRENLILQHVINMKKLLCTALCASALFCSCGDPTFDASQADESTMKILTSLSGDEQAQFKSAMQRIGLAKGIEAIGAGKTQAELIAELNAMLDGKTAAEIIAMSNKVEVLALFE